MSAEVSSETLQERELFLQSLTEFTEECRTRLTEVFHTLEWNPDPEQHSSQEKMEVCPYDANHKVPTRSLEKHKATCLLNQLEYSKEEQAEMYDPSFCYEEDCSTDPKEVPQNHKRAVCDLTVSDRLALYDHVQNAARQCTEAQTSSNDDLYVDLVSKLTKGEEKSGPKSHLEVLAEMRDYRRRRQSYRAKNVHITKKSYTEVIREVIDVHSEELARLWKEEQEELSKTLKHRNRTSDDEHSASAESHVSEERNSRHKHKKRSKTKDRKGSRSPERRHHKKKKKKS